MVNQNDLRDISVCWNDAFRRIFGLHRWESAAPVQFFTNNLSFEHMYNLLTWNFIDEVKTEWNVAVPEPVKFVYNVRKFEHNLVTSFADKYKFYGTSKRGKRIAIFTVFGNELEL